MRVKVSRDLGVSQKEFKGHLTLKDKGIKLDYLFDFTSGNMRFKPLVKGSIEKLEAEDSKEAYKILNNSSQKALRRYSYYKKFQEWLATLKKIDVELPQKVSLAFSQKLKHDLQSGENEN